MNQISHYSSNNQRHVVIQGNVKIVLNTREIREQNPEETGGFHLRNRKYQT